MLMGVWYQCEIVAHHINDQSAKDEEHSNPEAPIPMRVLPVRTASAMNGAVVVSFVRMFAVMELIHSFMVFFILCSIILKIRCYSPG